MASNSNSERTNVITMLCYKLERFTQPCISTPHGRGAHRRVYTLQCAVPIGIVLPFIAYIVYIALLDAVVDAFEDFLIDLLEFVDSSFRVFYRNFL